MKKIYPLVCIILISLSGVAQSGDGFKYQAVIRDANGNINANANINMEFSIVQGNINGTPVFTETHNVISNAHGIINLVIGSQNPESFALINWANGPYFVKISVDGLEFGTSQLMSVPYAMHAKTAESYSETDPLFSASPLTTITQEDIEKWSNKIDSIVETDPLFSASPSAAITQDLLNSWNNKPNSFIEKDSIFMAHPSSGINAAMMNKWNTAYDWGNHADSGYLKSFSETDPIFSDHPSYKITDEDINTWKAGFIWLTTNHYGFLTATNSVAGGITAADTALWNNGGGGSETDPIFGASVAKGITGSDTTYWNNKLSLEIDGSVTNEIQTLSISNDTIYLTNGGIAKLPTEVDGSTTNEIQTLSISNDTIYLTNGGIAKLPAEVDGSTTNEIQTLSISNDTIYLTNGGIAKLPAEVDGSTTNEIQTLSISNDTIYLTNGGSVKLPASGGGTSELTDLTDVSSSTKTAGNLLVANGTNFTSVTVSGDATLASSGALTIADNSVDGTDIALGSDATGDIMYYDGTNWVRLAAGTSGQLLQTNGSSAPTWVDAPSGSSSLPLTVISSSSTVSTASQYLLAEGGVITITLPASPTTGQILHILSNNSGSSLNPNGKAIRAGGTDYTTTDTFATWGSTKLTLYYNGTKWYSL